MSEEKRLTKAIIQDYVRSCASRGNRAIVGIPCRSQHCLGARAIKHAFGLNVRVFPYNRLATGGSTGKLITIEDDATAVLNLFEDAAAYSGCQKPLLVRQPVTVRQLQQSVVWLLLFPAEELLGDQVPVPTV